MGIRNPIKKSLPNCPFGLFSCQVLLAGLKYLGVCCGTQLRSFYNYRQNHQLGKGFRSVICKFICLSFFITLNAYADLSLDKLKKMADIREEFIMPEDISKVDDEVVIDFLNPSYSKATYFRRNTGLINFFGIYEKFLLNQRSFKRELLKAVNNSKNLDQIYLPLNSGNKIIVFGDIHGAFHSMVRNLTELKNQKIIDNSLKIIDPDVRIIFTGNIITRSPYSLETLLTVLNIFNKNPDKVIYMRGKQEDNKFWENYDFQYELQCKFNLNKSTESSLKQLLNKFFMSLPTKLFLQNPDGLKSYLVLLSDEEMKTRDLLKIEPNIKALIKNQDVEHVYSAVKGLKMLPYEEGLPVWTVFSSPNMIFRKIYNVKTDGFVCIDVGPSLSATNLTVFINDVDSEKLQYFHHTYHLLSSAKVDRGTYEIKDWLNYTIGIPLDLSKTARILGERMLAGIDMRIQKQNREEEGINNKLLRVIFRDDQYTPSLTVSNVKDLMNNHNVEVFLSPVGSPTTNSLVPFIKDKKILVLFPYSGAGILRRPDLRHILHYRTSYENEAYAVIKYAKENLLKHQFALFYQDDEYGHAGWKMARKLLYDKYGLSKGNICEAGYKRNTSIMNAQAEIIKACNPDVIVLFSVIAPTISLVNALTIPYLADTTLIGISGVSDRFKDFASGVGVTKQHSKGLEFIISSVVPNPNNIQLEMVKEYRRELDYHYSGAIPDVGSLEGYINASILIEALKNIKEPITMEKVVQELESMKDKDLLDIRLNFDNKTREFSKNIWLDTGEPEWIFMPAN